MKAKKLILTNLPYVLVGLACTNLGEAWRMASGGDASEKILSLFGAIPAAFGNPLPSFEGEPEWVSIEGDIDTFTDQIWNSLNEENKVSLFVRYINLTDGTWETRIVNKNK